ncbi:DotA/TraY family protein [Acetobacter vaccinii]|uniref:DotA/TraY family protein n=1 Tax=Acetobacter vaccinii TaxID=2592655 RepID=A0A5C1YT88_9PROT|nr:DotA/TraY family protein [Acetobacter vaccinii]QEO18858.1 DotA/TraY family protein [Acetobacter vaccinii]
MLALPRGGKRMRSVAFLRRGGAALGLLLFPFSALADSSASDVSWAKFDAGDDWSARVLDSIFTMDGASKTVVGTMLQQFTLYIMLIALFWTMYASLLQIHRIAETGKIFSDKVNAWAPVRTILAVLFLLPADSLGGYSLGQYGAMRIARAGIGMARGLETIVADKVGPEALPLTTPMIPNTRKVVLGVLNAELCRALVNTVSNNPKLLPEPSITVTGQGAVVVSYALVSGNATGLSTCGRIELVMPKKFTNGLLPDLIDFSSTASAQKEALTTLMNDMRSQAVNIITAFWSTRDSATFGSLATLISTENQKYTEALSTIASDAVSKIREAGGKSDSGVSALTALGWTGFGAYYLEIARLNAEVMSVATNTPSVQMPSWAGLGHYLGNDIAPYAQMIDSYMSELDKTMSDADAASATSTTRLYPNETLSDDPQGLLNTVFQKLGLSETVFTTMLNYLVAPSANGASNTQAWTDPLANLIGLGQFLLTLVLLMVGAAVIASSPTASAGAAVGSFFTGNFAGAAAGAAATLFSGAISHLLPVVFTVALMLFVPAVSLAYLLPMIPYFYWVAGVAGWYLLVIEMIVAVPIWALAHLVFEGDGLHGKGKRGYELLFTILFRPSLMVIGMVLSYSVFSAMSWLTMKTFSIAAGFVFDGGNIATNLVGVLVLLAAYTTLEIGWATMSFRLITTLPHHIPSLAGMDAANRVDSDSVANTPGEAAKPYLGQGQKMIEKKMDSASTEQKTSGSGPDSTVQSQLMVSGNEEG